MSECPQLSNGAYRFSLVYFFFEAGMAKYQSKDVQTIYEFAIIDLYHFTITILQVLTMNMKEHIVSNRTDAQRSCFINSQHTREGGGSLFFFLQFSSFGLVSMMMVSKK